MRISGTILLAALLALSCCSPPAPKTGSDIGKDAADTVFVNGNVITMDPEHPKAQAVAIIGDRIILVGTNEEAMNTTDEGTEVIDLGGKTVVPGLIDAHCHVASYGDSLRKLNLVGTESLEEIIALVKEKVKKSKPGEWIVGRGWDQNDWKKKHFPTNDALSAISPDNPVYLTRICGHAAFVNRLALKLAGVTKDTLDPPGGKIHKDPVTGEPTGVLIDTASSLVSGVRPGMTRRELRECIELAINECLKVGLTGVHDAGVSATEIAIYKELASEGKLNLRVYAMVDGGSGYWLANKPEIGAAGGFLTVRSIKLFSDGALGSRGAALLAPYSDSPGNSGLLTMTTDAISAVTQKALCEGYQVCTHAIGDRANRVVLDGYEAALKAVPVKDHRLRVEHAQVLAPEDIPRFGKLGIIASMQPTHCTSDMYWAGDRLGAERVKGAYVWRSLLKTGAKIASGSDFPIESNNPLWGIYAAVTRQDHKGWPEGGWFPQQRMTREEALRSFTVDAAYAAFEEKLKGSLAPGRLADMTVLSKDIMSVPAAEILDTHVEMTIIGGKTVYKSPAPGSAGSSK